jgi:hypothetical protein
MDAKDLMIGDWVLYRGDPIMIWEIDEYYDRVNTEPDGYNGITCVEISDINPIPLTPEILEKNGFVRHAAYDGWLISDDNGGGIIEYRTDYFDGMLRINYTKKPFSKISIKLKHVHELQHALRLCNISKEIKL